MLSLGAALGGIVSGVWGVYPAFIIDSLTFLVSALLILRIRTEPAPAPEPHTAHPLRTALAQYLEGLAYLKDHVTILVTALHKTMIAAIAGSTFEIVLVSVAEEVFTIGVGGGIGLGFMFMMTGVGSGISPILTRIFTGDDNRKLSIAIAAGYAMVAVGYLVVYPLASYGITLFGILLRGLGGGVIWAFSSQLLLQQVPGQVRGRVFATEFAFFMLAGSIGAFIVGRALDAFSISSVIGGLGTLILIPGILWTLWVVRQMRRGEL